MPRRFELEPTPVILAGLLVLGLAAQLLLPQPSPLARSADVAESATSQRAGRIAPGLAAPLRSAPAPLYAAILGRPLFSPGRSSAASVAGDASPVGALALLGLASEGPRASATVAAAGGAPRSLRLGEVFLGWRLNAVGRNRAFLSRDKTVQVLVLGAPPTTATPAAGAPSR